MLGVAKTFKGYDGKELISVWIKNNCDFEFSKNGDPTNERFAKGYCSFGTQDKFNPVDCKKFGISYKIDIYKNSNEEEPMFTVFINENNIVLFEPKDKETSYDAISENYISDKEYK